MDDVVCCCLPLIPFLLLIVYWILDRLIRVPSLDPTDRCIFITGCDTGLGNALARRLDAKGCRVFAGCLTEIGEVELKKACSSRLVTVPLDVTKPDSVRKAYRVVQDRLRKDEKKLWGLVNNAGNFLVAGPADWMTVDDYRRGAEVNLYGMIDVTMTFLPLIKSSRGRVVNTSSMAARVTWNYVTPYSVSKYGVEAFTDGLRRTLRPFGCQALLIEPGVLRTKLASQENVERNVADAWKKAQEDVKAEYGQAYFDNLRKTFPLSIEPVMSPVDTAVDAFEQALFASYPRARYMPGTGITLALLIQRLPERLGDWICEKAESGRMLPAAVEQRQTL